MTKNVVIEVRGGTAELISKPDDISVDIIDHDNNGADRYTAKPQVWWTVAQLHKDDIMSVLIEKYIDRDEGQDYFDFNDLTQEQLDKLPFDPYKLTDNEVDRIAEKYGDNILWEWRDQLQCVIDEYVDVDGLDQHKEDK